MKNSPWGKVQNSQILYEGVVAVSTGRHGGVKVYQKLNKLIPAYARKKDGWYEEDCEIAIPFFFLSVLNKKDQSENTLKNYFPSIWETATGKTLKLGESVEKDRTTFEKENINNWVVTSAYGDWHANVPKGKVGVVATLGGNRDYSNSKQFLIDEAEYKNRGQFDFVIDLTKHKETSFS